MKFIAIPILMILIATQAFSKWVMLFEFQLNRDFISKNLCENRAKPNLKCGGKCQLMKAMEKEEKGNETKEKKRKIEERQAKKQLDFLSNHEKETKRFLKYIKSKMVPRLGRYTVEYITRYKEITIGKLDINTYGLTRGFIREKTFGLDHDTLKERMKKEFADCVTFRESSTNEYTVYYMIIKWA